MGYLKWVQNPINTLGVQTGVNVILPILPLQKGVPRHPKMGYIWDPLWLGNMLDFKPVNVIFPLTAAPGGGQNGVFGHPFLGPF